MFTYNVTQSNQLPVTQGRLQGPLILGTLAYHMSVLLELPEKERTEEWPRGALAMSVLAV